VAQDRRPGYRRAFLVAAALLALTACNPNRFVSGWVPHWAASEGRAGFTNAAATPMFSDISPFFFTATAPEGAPVNVGSETQLKLTVDAAKARGLKVLPSITDGTGKGVMAAILADPPSRAAHVADLVGLVVNRGYDGIDLDYEGFAFADDRPTWDTTRPNWVTFVNELAAALHDKGKLLSITIPPTWIEVGVLRGYPVYDPAAMGAVADRVRLMVYDWSFAGGPPGPISPITWLNLVIAYNDPIIPNAKLQLGVPSYGRNWGRKVNTGESCPTGALKTSSVELQNVQALIDAHGASPTRHNSGEMTFSYDVVETGYGTVEIPPPPFIPPDRVAPSVPGAADGDGLQPALRLTPPLMQLTCTVRHFVYYPDAATIQQHAQAALAAGWSGIVIWALGYETPDVYYALANTTP
jgi:spore germination protein YaaH